MKKNDNSQEIIDKLKEDLNSYEIFFNNSIDGFFVHKDGVPIIINDAALKLINVDRKDIMNYSLLEFIDEESKKIVEENIKNKFEGSYEVKIKSMTGEKYYCLLTVKNIIYRAQPARLVIMRNITEQKIKLISAKREKEIIEKQRKALVAIAKLGAKVGIFYEDIIESIIEMSATTLNILSAGFFLLSDDKKYLKSNILIGEFNNKSININFNDDLKNYLENRITILNSSNEIRAIFHWMEEENRSVIMAPIRYEGDLIGMLIYTKNDINWPQYDQDFIASVADMIMLTFERWNRKWIEVELEQNLEQMKKLNKIKSDFISMISHELRTPLTSIIGFVSLLLKGVGGRLSAEQFEFINSIKNNSTRLLKLINEILDVAKIEKGTFAVQKTMIDIVELVNKVLDEMKVITEIKKAKITPNYQENTIIISGDYERLSQVIANIIDNAIKYSDKNIEIEINIKIINSMNKEIQRFKDIISPNIQYVLINIKDNGIGIAKENVEKIFNMFTQVEDINTRTRGGVGLGLYIASQIIKEHNGFIWAESEGVGMGTEFKILLPQK